MTIRACIFDAYGTLFDIAGAAREAAEEPGRERLKELWPRLAEDWRQKQLQYTWLRAAAGRHADFWQVTCDGLDWALEAAGLDDPALRTRLLDLYRRLPAYPEVPAVLSALKAKGLHCAILTNGTPGMMEDALVAAGIGGHLDAVLSAEEAGVFKPSPKVYDLVGQRFGTDPSEVLFVSANGWDAAGGAGYGFRTLWVNRTGAPSDRLYAEPAHVASDLTGVPDLV
ncbi:haloacid dehalogenase type II [Histidinibacterium aquaticum]|uniref:(S)-2-haloacid dehalogenase n=1 Tax=Histidinibacterium aquaticum TaxID=2613962 RepID=A0A5J5GJ42_9RHOB|nr:haloacid dehalogenase type II [Histidinibacterium aquaticum]KAA9008165.1 haloacid dehalogenase type II [Histidinibacterium aquaticum]